MPTDLITIATDRPGLHEITEHVRVIADRYAAGDGLCTVYIRHTSASLTIQENADPSARRDLEVWLNQLVPPHNPAFTHVAEGPDDMPSHIKSALTATSLGIPIAAGRLVLGTWQGIYLWEHRTAPHTREIAVHILNDGGVFD